MGTGAGISATGSRSARNTSSTRSTVTPICIRRVHPALAPELRQLNDTSRVHRVPDYTGATKEERVERMNQIVQIAKDNGYDSVFAGYGFMAEDDEFVAAIEKAGLKFIGPCSATQHECAESGGEFYCAGKRAASMAGAGDGAYSHGSLL